VTPWSRQMTSRPGSPVALGSTSSPLTFRFAWACGVSFTRIVFDMKRGLCAASDPPGDRRSVIARTNAVEKRIKPMATNGDTTFRCESVPISPLAAANRQRLVLIAAAIAALSSELQTRRHSRTAKKRVNRRPCRRESQTHLMILDRGTGSSVRPALSGENSLGKIWATNSFAPGSRRRMSP
jgi:hypothetical protein